MAGTPEPYEEACLGTIFYYYHTNHLGSLSVITDIVGNPVEHYSYNCFGNELFNLTSETFDVSNRYTGQVYDDDTELYYYGA